MLRFLSLKKEVAVPKLPIRPVRPILHWKGQVILLMAHTSEKKIEYAFNAMLLTDERIPQYLRADRS